MSDLRESSRLKASERTIVLDEATRKRRLKKALEALEKDNFQDEAGSALHYTDYRMQMTKKLQQRFGVGMQDADSATKENEQAGGEASEPKKRRLKSESRLRFRKNFASMLEEEQALTEDKKYNYFTINAPPSHFPPRKFCAVCGFLSNYTCIQCGARYCAIKCMETHKETRCLKWVS